MPDSPIIPGPTGDGYNMMEVTFHNGEAHMKEKVSSAQPSMATKTVR